MLLSSGQKVKTVYLQFHDAAGNELLVMCDEILYNPSLYLPVLRR